MHAPLLSSAVAYEITQDQWKRRPIHEVELAQAQHQILAEDIKADRDYPPIQRATMDGICVSFNHYQSGAQDFNLRGTIKAGEGAQFEFYPSYCYEIMTGACVPEGFDLVIPYEDIVIHGEKVKLHGSAIYKRWDNVHQQGSDGQEGDVFLRAGVKVIPAHISILASFGYDKIKVVKKPRILIISTGDELVEINQKRVQHFQLRQSNRWTLDHALKLFGFHDVKTDHLKDEREEIANHFSLNEKSYDLMIYTGGVSKGKHDYLPQIWSEHHVTCLFHGVCQKPGKPMWFGHKNHLTVMGLPGNPLSSLICLYRYLLQDRPQFAKLAQPVQFSKKLTYFCPARMKNDEDGTLWVEPIEMNTSGDFISLATSSGFMELRADQDQFLKGEVVPFYSWMPLC